MSPLALALWIFGGLLSAALANTGDAISLSLFTIYKSDNELKELVGVSIFSVGFCTINC